jgi:hypothetical protein
MEKSSSLADCAMGYSRVPRCLRAFCPFPGLLAKREGRNVGRRMVPFGVGNGEDAAFQYKLMLWKG